MELTASFWDNRYKKNDIGWDLGEVSPPLKAYFNQLKNKQLKILIPGGGNAHEAEYLHTIGFKNVYVLDLSKTALNNIKTRVPSFPVAHLIHNDFFKLDLTFDLIIEHTFFCAIDPNLRPAYAAKAFELLKTYGKVAGLLFDAPLNETHPPFGGCKAEYIDYFKPYFNILLMEASYNSIQSRQGKELFLKLKKTIKNTYELYLNTLFILEAQKQNVITTQNNFDRTQERYTLGQVTSIEFRQAQINLLNTQTAVSNAKYNAKLIELEQLQLTGDLLNVPF